MYIYVQLQAKADLYISKIPDGRYILSGELFSPSSPLYPDTVILISLQGESVISLNCNT